jgi:multidrug efflux pump subunit AcrA (membrane-fusion protein)
MNEVETKTPPTTLEAPKKVRRRSKFSRLLILTLLPLGLGYGVSRLLSQPKPNQSTHAAESKVVPVVRAVRENLQTDVTLQAEFIPYQDIMVHAKVSGFVSMIKVDIGDRVKQGDLLATLEIPELQDNINKAKAKLSATVQEIDEAQANYTNLRLIYQRLADVAKAHPNLVARSTRTMTTEVDVANPQGVIKAGMYAYVNLPLRVANQALAVPLQALPIGDNPTVLVLAKDGRLEERKVKVGIRTADKAEIVRGLEEGDPVVVGNRAGLDAGEKVKPKFVGLAKLELAQKD